MKKLSFLLIALTLASQAWAGCFPSLPSFARWQDGCGQAWWNDSSLTFYAPFDNPSDPLRLIRGTGSLSFTRATTATYVHPTTGLITSAASGQLRIESNGALIEGQRTNQAPYSEQFNNDFWLKEAISVSANVATSPDGTNTADKLIPDVGIASHFLWPYTWPSNPDNSPVTHSVFMKQGEWSWGFITIEMKSGGRKWAYFDLSSGVIGTVTSGATANIETFNNDWYRVSISVADIETGITSNYFIIGPTTGDNVETPNGDGSSGIYICGAQRELAPFPSSYIPTTTAAVTRNADVLKMGSDGNFSFLTGTLVVTASALNSGGGLLTGEEQYTTILRFGANNLVASHPSSSNVGVSWLNNSVSNYYQNGSLKETNASFTRWGASDSATLIIGDNNNDAIYVLFGNIKNLRIWNKSMTDDQLVALTQ